MIGKVTGQELKENRDGAVVVRLLQVQFSNESDIQTVQYMPMSGDDSPPQNNDMVAVLSIGPSFKIAFAVQDSVVPSMQPGEKKFYSRNNIGDVAAVLSLLLSGNIEAITPLLDVSGHVSSGTGTSGSFASGDGKTVTVQDGQTIGIV